MEALQSIGQFFARWLAQLETTFVEKQRYLLLVDGLKNTLIITAGALVIGVVIGSLVAMIKYCGQDSRLLRPLCWLCSVYTTVIRGVPVVVQLLIFYFLILKSSDGLVVGIVTFGINSGAYVAELVRSGITEIIFAVGYKGSMVEEYFKDGSEFGFQASYAYEETLLGTAGAIKNAGKFITEDRFYVLNADTFYQIDYTRLAKQQDDQNLDMALVLRQVPDVSRYGKAILDENGILTGFNEKTADPVPGTINGGIYLMKKSLLEEIPEGKVSLENEMIPKWLSEGKKLGGFVNDGYFIDIGIPEAYFQFQEDVKTGVVH